MLKLATFVNAIENESIPCTEIGLHKPYHMHNSIFPYHQQTLSTLDNVTNILISEKDKYSIIERELSRWCLGRNRIYRVYIRSDDAVVRIMRNALTELIQVFYFQCFSFYLISFFQCYAQLASHPSFTLSSLLLKTPTVFSSI